MYFFSAKSLLTKLLIITDVEILEADSRKITFGEDRLQIIALMVISQIILEIKILIVMDLYLTL